MKLTTKEIAQTNKVFELITQIRAKGIAEFSSHFGMYSCVNQWSINLMPPSYKDANGFSLDYEIQYGAGSITKNKECISLLEQILEFGIIADERYAKKKAEDLIKKEMEFKKLKKELGF